MHAFTHEDDTRMRLALRLAQRGLGSVEPNPMVGCVMARGRRILGVGYHRRFGGPHAEIEALRDCPPGGARGATAYVTLEPCCYHGKTPPCTEALLAAGVARVLVGTLDPNPRVAGRGVALLRKRGVTVEVGLREHEARELIAPFARLMTGRRPWVILKWGQSLDGKIATRSGDARWITDEAMRAHAHRVRGRLDALLVGIGTVLADDPLLTCRVGRPRRVATRVVLDSNLRIPPDSRLVRSAGSAPVLVYASQGAARRKQARLERAGCEVVRVPAGAAGLSLRAVLRDLGRRQMTNVLVEGGGRILGAFADAGLADEYHIYVAPLLIGGADAPSALGGRGPARLGEAIRLVGPGGPGRAGGSDGSGSSGSPSDDRGGDDGGVDDSGGEGGYGSGAGASSGTTPPALRRIGNGWFLIARPLDR